MDTEQYKRAAGLVKKMYIFGIGKDDAFEEACELFGNAAYIAVGRGKKEEAIEILNLALTNARHLSISKKHLSNEFTAKIAEQLLNVYFTMDTNDEIIEQCQHLYRVYLTEQMCVSHRYSAMGDILQRFGLYNVSMQEYGKAAEFFRDASAQYINAGANSSNSIALNHLAKCYVNLANYAEAQKIYMTLAANSLASPLTSSRAHVYYMNGILCLLVASNGDSVYGRGVYNMAADSDYKFESSSAGRFINDTLKLLESDTLDITRFVDLMTEYDSITKLTPEQVSLLLGVKTLFELSTETIIDLT